MKTRRMTKFGMATIELCGDPEFRKVTFDKKVALHGHMSLFTWLINVSRLDDL